MLERRYHWWTPWRYLALGRKTGRSGMTTLRRASSQHRARSWTPGRHERSAGDGRRARLRQRRAPSSRPATWFSKRTMQPIGNIEARLRRLCKRRSASPSISSSAMPRHWLKLAAGNPFHGRRRAAQVVVRVMREPLDRSVHRKRFRSTLQRQRAHGSRRRRPLDRFRRQAERDAKLLSALTTKRLGVGTLRNWNTVRGLAEMIG